MITVTAKVVVPKCSLDSNDKKRVFIVHNPMVEPMKLSTLSQRISKHKRTQIKDKKIAECVRRRRVEPHLNLHEKHSKYWKIYTVI